MRDLSRRIESLEKLVKPAPVRHMPGIQKFLDEHRSGEPETDRTRCRQTVFQRMVETMRASSAMPIASFALLLSEEEKLYDELSCGLLAASSSSEISKILEARCNDRLARISHR